MDVVVIYSPYMHICRR